ncbi:K02A2.6-like [Cordylochernes scorpioides]|uniref:K02A2.6-like n=1 Tax=Cordylochernes scorpioides TaxID=51811 RepID=A0ABY6K7J9_9ARAC|nr:K02A2.6-like [Cordylochernes scorpioides]
MSKTPKGPKYGELGELPESPLTFDLVSKDTIAGFARYESAKNYLHVVVDHATRFAWIFPSRSTSTTTYIQVIKRVLQSGCPKRLLTDRALAITSPPRFRRFLISHNIQPMLTTSNHPQANGLSEGLNATLTRKLRLLHLQHPRVSWSMLQTKVVKAYNDTSHSVTGFPPSYLMNGSLPKELSQHLDPYPSVTESRHLALQRTKEGHKLDKIRFDKNHRFPDFEVGDLVLTKIYQHPNTGKLVPYFSGPYEIIEVISPYTVRINRPNQAQNLDTEIIHVNKLVHYSEDTKYIFTPHSTNNNSVPKSHFIYHHFPPEIFHDDYKNYASTLSNPFNHMNPDIFLDNDEPTLTARYISTPDTIPKIDIQIEPSPTTKIVLPSSPTQIVEVLPKFIVVLLLTGLNLVRWLRRVLERCKTRLRRDSRLKNLPKPQPSATIGRDASADPVVLNPNIDIPKYDGTEDPRPWIESLEEIGFLYHWAEYIISCYAAMNMIGSAKTWLDLHKISFTSWEHFKSRLIQDFGSDANKEELKMRLNRMQQWNEPAIRFAEDILVLCNKVDPQMEEENKINWVIGGLKKEYSFALYLNPPKNTNELLRLCKKMDLFENNYQERIEKSKALYNGPRSPRSHHQEQWKNAPSFRRPDQNTSKPPGPRSEVLPEHPKPQAPRSEVLPEQAAAPDSNRNRTEDGRPICFKCNKPGHVARYCRVKFVRIVEEDPSVSQDKSQENLQMDERKDYTRPRLYADVCNDTQTNIPTRNRYSVASIEAEDGEYVIEENNRMTQTNGLRLARSLLTVTDKKTHIWITNPYPRPLKIMKDQTLAYGSLPAGVNFIENKEKQNENDEIQFQINKNLSFKEQERLKQILAKYTDLFSWRLGRTNLAKHQIHTEDAKPIKHKPYRVSAKERTIIKDQIDEMLEEGIIRQSSSPWKLNEVTMKDVYSNPRIDDVMDTLQGSKYFSAIDLKSGYWQVEIEERDKEKTAFTTAHGLYEFNVMPFGLCNAPATFERNMDNVLGNLRWQICLCYLDDVIIYSSDFPTHIKRLEAVLRCFSESNLKLNAKKCRFAFEELEILGHITKRPKKAKEVQSFLGMCSYYRKFIKDFSLIADPLTSLIRKNVQFIWTGKQEEAFQNLKKALMNPPILGHFDPNAATCIHTDASNIGLGATLIQNIGGEEKVISYLSRTLKNEWDEDYERLFLNQIIDEKDDFIENIKENLSGNKRSITQNFKEENGCLYKKNPNPEENEWDEDYERLFLNQIIDEKGDFIENIKENLSGNKRSITQNFKEENGCLYKKNPNPEVGKVQISCHLDYLDKIERTKQVVINNTEKTQERMKRNYDKKHNERIYEPGHLVAVWTPVRKIGKCEKLLRKYFGPYRILKKLSNVNYLIEPKDNPGQDPLIVHVSRLKPYFERIDEVTHEDVTTSGEGESLPLEQLLDYECLVHALTLRFGDDNLQPYHVVKLKNRLQKRDETLQELVADVRRLARLAFPDCPRHVQDLLAHQNFVDAIEDPECQQLVRMSDARTLKEALIHALKFEAARDATRSYQKVMRLMKADESQEDGDIKEAISRLQKTVEEMKKSMSFSESAPGAYRQRTYRPNDKTICWNCGKPGHIRTNCRVRLTFTKRGNTISKIFRRRKLAGLTGPRLDKRCDDVSVKIIRDSSLQGRSNELTTEGLVNGVPCRMVIDSGANVTLLRVDLAQRMGSISKRIPVSSELIGNNLFSHLGYLTDIKDDCLIGSDVLRKFGFSIDFQENERSATNKVLKVILKSDVKIPLRSECILEEHLINLERVLQKIRGARLKLNPRKCQLFKEKFCYLGHVISHQGIQTDPDRTETVRQWPIPSDVHQLRSFLGLCSYYRRFVPGFSNITRPLHLLTESGRPFSWTVDCERAMDKLKKALSSPSMLAYPDPGEQLILDTDASNIGIRAVLSQPQDGVERVIAYFSKTLSKPERNYCVTRKGLLAIVKSIEHFRHYLYGQKFLFRTDHAALRWLFNFKSPEGQLIRWGFSDFKTCPRGRTQVRRMDPEEMRKAQLEDADLRPDMNWLNTGTNRPAWEDVASCSSITKSYWSSWDSLELRDSRAKLKTYNVRAPFERIAIDIIGPLPRSDKGNRYILVAMDYFTKWPEAFPLADQEAETVAEALISQFFSRFSVPMQIHTDQGRNFESRLFTQMRKLLGSHKIRTTSLHPQSYGMNQRDWDSQLPILLMAYRSSVHETTGYSQAKMLFGRELKLPCDLIFGCPNKVPRYHRLPRPKSRQDSGRQGTSKQIDHCLYRKMEQGRKEDSKEPMESDTDYESGESTTFPKKETTLGRTQEIVPSQEDVTPPPPVSDILGRLTTTLHQLSAVTGHRERWNRYDGSYEAQSFFTNYDAQADRAQLQYSTRLRKPANLLQAPLRVTNTRAVDIEVRLASGNTGPRGPKISHILFESITYFDTIITELTLTLNKLQMATGVVKFLGHTISQEGISPDQDKVRAIQNMQIPKNKQELQRILGTVTYLAKFILDLSSNTSNMRNLLKKDIIWNWNIAADQELNFIKTLLTSPPVLRHFDPNEPLKLFADASKDGLGAILMQKEKPLSYASASLTSPQKHYSQIEKELLALYFGCKRFHYFLYGQITNQVHEPRSFYVKDQEGNEYRRNSIHIRKDKRNETDHTDWEKPSKQSQEQANFQDLEDSPSQHSTQPPSSGPLSSPGSPKNLTTTGPPKNWTNVSPKNWTNVSPKNLITSRSGRVV